MKQKKAELDSDKIEVVVLHKVDGRGVELIARECNR